MICIHARWVMMLQESSAMVRESQEKGEWRERERERERAGAFRIGEGASKSRRGKELAFKVGV